jgi:hypothetical protein
MHQHRGPPAISKGRRRLPVLAAGGAASSTTRRLIAVDAPPAPQPWPRLQHSRDCGRYPFVVEPRTTASAAWHQLASTVMLTVGGVPSSVKQHTGVGS